MAINAGAQIIASPNAEFDSVSQEWTKINIQVDYPGGQNATNNPISVDDILVDGYGFIWVIKRVGTNANNVFDTDIKLFQGTIDSEGNPVPSESGKSVISTPNVDGRIPVLWNQVFVTDAVARRAGQYNDSMLGFAKKTTTENHISNVSNPHQVTKAQIGLGNVTNDAAIPMSYLDTSGTLSANSDVKVPSQKAVRSYVTSQLATNNAMVYKGTINCSTNPNYPAGNAGDLYICSAAGKIGGASGATVNVGYMIICKVDGSVSGTHAAVGANWDVVNTTSSGTVTGPSTSIVNNFAAYNSTDGVQIKDSGVGPSSFATASHTHDHNTLTNYVADRHVAHSDVSISPGAGLTGGGTIAASRTLSLGTPSDCSPTVTSAASGTTHTHKITGVAPEIHTHAQYLPLTGGTVTGHTVFTQNAGGASAGTITLQANTPTIMFKDTTTATRSTFWLRAGGGNFYLLQDRTTGGEDDNTDNWTTPFPLLCNSSGVIILGQTPFVGADKVWHAGNDGATSGLDADMVDGVHASSLVQTTRNITAGNGLTGGGTLASDRTLSITLPVTITKNSTNNSGSGTTGHSHQITGYAEEVHNHDHNTLTNYFANRHIDHSLVEITAGNGLTGGGTIAATRTVTLGTPGTVSSTSTNSVTAISHTHAFDTAAFSLSNHNHNTTYLALSGGTLTGNLTISKSVPVITLRGSSTSTNTAIAFDKLLSGDDSAVSVRTASLNSPSAGGIDINAFTPAESNAVLKTLSLRQDGTFTWAGSDVLTKANATPGTCTPGSSTNQFTGTTHTHAITGVATSTHSHNATDINAGTLANARLPARLQEYCQQITDWNTAITTGFYKSDGNGSLNTPDGSTSSQWYIGTVVAHTSTYITQTVHAFLADGPLDTQTYRRDYTGGSWKAWYRLRLSEEEQIALYVPRVGGIMTGNLLINATNGGSRVILTDTGTTNPALEFRSNNSGSSKTVGIVRSVPDGGVDLIAFNADSTASRTMTLKSDGTFTWGGTDVSLSTHTHFAAGTKMLFNQTAAPTGWTKVTTSNDCALRVVSGTVGSGGSANFSAAFSASNTGSTDLTTQAGAGETGSHVLTVEEMPNHSHLYHYTQTNNSTSTGSGALQGALVVLNQPTTAVGGSQGHTHTAGSHTHTINGHTHSLALAVKYVDVIIASHN